MGRMVARVMACRINSALAHVIVFQPLGEVGIFFLGHAGFDHMAAVGRVVFFLQALTSFLARQGA